KYENSGFDVVGRLEKTYILLLYVRRSIVNHISKRAVTSSLRYRPLRGTYSSTYRSRWLFSSNAPLMASARERGTTCANRTPSANRNTPSFFGDPVAVNSPQSGRTTRRLPQSCSTYVFVMSPTCRRARTAVLPCCFMPSYARRTMCVVLPSERSLSIYLII